MAVVVVGGQSRKVGKTSVVEGLIRGLAEMRWTAMKVSEDGHGMAQRVGGPNEHRVAVSEERNISARTDSSRYLAAGAVRSLWIRTRPGDLGAAMPLIHRELGSAQNAIVESNSILGFLQPDVFLMLLDPLTDDFKDSAHRYLDRADAVVVSEAGMKGKRGPMERIGGIPVLLMRPPEYVTGEVLAFVEARLATGPRTASV